MRDDGWFMTPLIGEFILLYFILYHTFNISLNISLKIITKTASSLGKIPKAVTRQSIRIRTRSFLETTNEDRQGALSLTDRGE
jgi:hypothetical protein